MANVINYAVVPGKSKQEAVENAHNVFSELCPDGNIPIFDWYSIPTIPDSDEPRTFRLTNTETQEMVNKIWNGTIETLREKDIEGAVYTPETAARARLYRLYDNDSRPVLSRPHFTKLLNKENRWVIPAQFSY